jgi:glycerate kinase
MEILIAPNAFKGSLSAQIAAQMIEKAFMTVMGDKASCKLVPLADGGDGTTDIIIATTQAQTQYREVSNAIGNKIKAKIGFISECGIYQKAVIGIADASGIASLKKEEYAPLTASTYGTGQLISYAIEKGAKEILLGIGGSATTDAGVGILQALGFRFTDERGNEIEKGGQNLQYIAHVMFPPNITALQQVKIKILCDVDNPLLGEKGTARVFAPQKGASSEEIAILEKSLTHFSTFTRQYTNKDITTIKHGGAAGGTAAGLYAYLNVELVNGFEEIAKITNLENHIRKADLVITGEGKLDSQTLSGKVPYSLALLAKKHHKPIIGIFGQIESPDEVLSEPFTAVFATVNRLFDDNKQAILQSKESLYFTSLQVAQIISSFSFSTS